MRWWVLLQVACVPPADPETSDTDGPARPRPHTGLVQTAETGATSSLSTAFTGHTGDTSVEPPVDCSVRPAVGAVVSTGYVTEEDFDFDPRGFLVSQRNQNIEGLDRYGNTRIYAASVGADPAGLRVLSTGDLAVAQPDTGALMMVDDLTGGHGTVLSGLSFPNALATDSRGYVFVSEYTNPGRVRQVDVYTGEQWAVAANLNRPNGVALSPDENTIYIAEAVAGGHILAIDRIDDTTWGTPRVLFTPPSGTFFTIAVDICGNLYIVDYSFGDLYRIPIDGSPAEYLIDVDTVSGNYSALRFGNGVGGWERDKLYVTRRAELYQVDIGIMGRDPVYPVY